MKTKGAKVDAFSPVMNDCGDKLVTTQGSAVCGKSKKRKHGKPVASVKFGSAVVPIYQLASAGRKRFILSFYMEGKRERRSFTNLESAKKEAQLVAQRIQGGRQEMNDLRPHDREAYRTVVDLLMPSGVPLVTAVQEYVRANKLLNGLPLLTRGGRVQSESSRHEAGSEGQGRGRGTPRCEEAGRIESSLSAPASKQPEAVCSGFRCAYLAHPARPDRRLAPEAWCRHPIAQRPPTLPTAFTLKKF
jgi:hypothetical protein